jgi:hypothetical protein
MPNHLGRSVAATLLLTILGANDAGALDFYEGKEVTIYTGSAPGGPYDPMHV